MKSVPRAGLALSFLLTACAPAELARPRSVVLVVVDALRADHVGALGYERQVTPRLDALAAAGVTYSRAYAGSSAVGQSLSALWTGRLPSSGGSTGLLEATPHPGLVTLPRMFARAGFRTGLVSNQPLLRERAFTRGFDDIEVDSVVGRWSGAQVTGKALELVDQAAGAPFFLVVDFADAGEPHLPPPSARARIDVPAPPALLSLPALRAAAGRLDDGIEESAGFQDLVARYDAELAYVDACLGALVDGLEERRVLEQGLLIVTSSHGVEFLEHGYVGHSWTLYDEVVRVPLVVHSPHHLSPARIGRPVSLADVAPTLRHVFSLDAGPLPLDGLPLFDPTPAGLVPRVPRGTVITELVLPELCVLRAVVDERWKLVEVVRRAPPADRLQWLDGYDERIAALANASVPRPDPWGEVEVRELFDLTHDPAEWDDRSDVDWKALEQLARLLDRYEEFCRAYGLDARDAVRRAELPDPEDVEQLNQLGYL